MIDSHCHLDHEPLFSNINDVINRSKKAGVKKILTISTNFKSFENIKNIIKIDDIIYGSIGVLIAFMSWIYLISSMLLIGFEWNTSIDIALKKNKK